MPDDVNGLTNLDERIRRWRMGLALRHGLLKRELDELEDHVRQQLVNHPADDPVQALDASLRELGSGPAIARELRRVRRFDGLRIAVGIAVMLTFSIGLLSLGFWGQLDHLIGTVIDPWSVLWIGGLVIGGLLASYRPSVVIRTAGICLRCRTAGGVDDLIDAAGVLARGRQLALASGVVGSLVGIITMLMAVNDFEAIGAGTGVALICMLYGLVLAEFAFAPMLHTVQQRREQIENAAAIA